MFLKHKCISLLCQLIFSLTRNTSFKQSLQTYFLDLETVKNVALVDNDLLKVNLITPKQSRKQHSTIEYELYIKSLIFYFMLQQITYLQFHTTRSYQLLRGLFSQRLVRKWCLAQLDVVPSHLCTEEHKTQGAGGSVTAILMERFSIVWKQLDR